MAAWELDANGNFVKGGSHISNCYISLKKGETFYSFCPANYKITKRDFLLKSLITETNEKMYLDIDGYAIIPIEKYNELKEFWDLTH